MRQLVIDRFEGDLAVCEDVAECFCISIPCSELPEDAKEGDVLWISETGELFPDPEETSRRRERIAEKQRKLFERGGGQNY